MRVRGPEGLGSASERAAEHDGEGLDYPRRPYVPFLLVVACTFVVAENVVLRGFVGARVVIGCGVAAALAGCVLALARRRAKGSRTRAPGRVLAVGAALVASALLAHVTLARTDAAAAELTRTRVSALELVIVADPSETSTGWMSRALTTLPSGARASVWLTTTERPALGDRLSCVGRFSANADDEWGRSSRSRGVSGRIRAVRVMGRKPAGGLTGALVRLRGTVVSGIAPEKNEARALMAGVIAADRTQLKAQGTENAFAAVGLSHLVAVSGSHLVVVGAGLEAALLALGAGPRLRAGGTLLVSGLYVLFCASPSSAVRSWVMLAASCAGRAVGRRAHAPTAVAVAALVMCAYDPTCACDLGFQLSALSVCALSLFARHMEAMLSRLSPLRPVAARLPDRLTRRLRPLGKLLASARSTLAASLVCQAATLPACAATFGSVSLLAPVANVVAGPIFGPIVSVGVVACAVAAVPLVGTALMLATELMCATAVWVSRLMASVPYASVPVSAEPVVELVPFALAACALAAWPRPSRRTLLVACGAVAAGALCWLLFGVVLVGPRVVVLDVGQGDAILVRHGTHALLVDTGPGDAVVEALARQGVFSLDAVVITHLHDDHTGGLDDLAGLVRVGSVVVAEGVGDGLSPAMARTVERLTGRGVVELARGDALRVGGFTLTSLWPQEPVDGSENEHSLCLLLEYGEDGESRAGGAGADSSGDAGARGDARASPARAGPSLTALLTGDAESEVLGQIVDEVGDVDLLKVGHHGSAVSIEPDQARSLAPEASVASAGEGNSYGHPREECVEVLEGAGSRFLCTKDAGDVTVEPDVGGVRVTCARRAA